MALMVALEGNKKVFILSCSIYISLDIHKYPQNSARILEQTHSKKHANVAAYENNGSLFFVFSKTSWTMSRFPPKQLKSSWFLP